VPALVASIGRTSAGEGGHGRALKRCPAAGTSPLAHLLIA
jgi:hypothetical protein